MQQGWGVLSCPWGEGQPNNSAGRGTESLRRGEAEGKGKKKDMMETPPAYSERNQLKMQNYF